MEKLDESKIYYWNKVIEDYKESGLTITKYCEMNNITRRTFYKWRKQVESIGNKECCKTMTFIPVTVTPKTAKQSSLIIDVKGSQITVDENTDLILLKKVMEVLQ